MSEGDKTKAKYESNDYQQNWKKNRNHIVPEQLHYQEKLILIRAKVRSTGQPVELLR